MYSEVFCKVYNEFGWNYYPEAFGQQLLRWIRTVDRPIRSCMDLGCGTGILCDLLHQSGIDASGTDLSESMIRTAKDNFPHLDFAVANMITFCPDRQFDLVTCTGDALNHIMSTDDVQTIFRNVYRYLSPGGYFIFDILNEQEVSPCEPFDCPFSDTVRAEFQILKSEDNIINLKTRVYEDGEFRFEENIYEILHDPRQICGLLEAEGFRVIQCADRLLPDENGSTTWYIIASK
jgi:SAM-dependent methyltransferase